MLTRLGLRNFKAFGDEMQNAELAPITLIYGPNSSGKSSIIQALRMLKQSHDAHEAHKRLEDSFTLVTNGNLVNLGSYSSLLHNHDEWRKLGVDIDYVETRRRQPRRRVDIWDNVSRLTVHPLNISNSISMEFERGLRNRAELMKLGYDFTSSNGVDIDAKYKINFTPVSTEQSGGSAKPPWRLGSGSDSSDSDSKESLESLRNFIQSMRDIVESTGMLRNPGGRRASLLSGFLRSMKEIESMRDMPTVTVDEASHGMPTAIRFEITLPRLEELSGIANYLPVGEIDTYKDHLDRLVYMGPLMSPPQRYYDVQEQPVSGHTVGVSGENVPQILRDRRDLKDRVNEWLGKFDIPYTINAEAVTFRSAAEIGDEVITISLTHRSTGTTVTLADVGFGINQILPVMLQGVLGERQIICVEQPEIHLHPALQAEFADFLIETSGAAKANNYEGVGNQWIVETHSEMVILRLLRRIRAGTAGTISHKDVSVLYVHDREGDGSSTIQRMEIDEDGRFEEDWPRGFFPEGYNETVGV